MQHVSARAPLGGRPYGTDNTHVSTAPADVATQGRANLLVAGVGITGQQSGSAHNEPGRAVAALEGRMLNEGLLEGMKCVSIGQTFDSGYFATGGGHDRRHAGPGRIAIQEDCACAAVALSAPVFRTC